MLQKFDTATKIISNEQIATNHFLLRCKCPKIAAQSKPGQFIHVLIDEGSNLLLRRPFTIYSIKDDEISMLYQIIGKGTKILSTCQQDQQINVLGPLGNCFDLSVEPDPAIVVGGGAGIASLMLLATALRLNGIRLIAMIGAMSSDRLLSVKDLEEIGAEIHITTDDGSFGNQGFVTDSLLAVLEKPTKNGLRNPIIFTCGPSGMLQAVTKIVVDYEIPCQVTMENEMGCALGVCLGCVCKVRSPNAGFEFQRVCSEGPVFNAKDIIW